MMQPSDTRTISYWTDLAVTKRAAGGSASPLIEFVELSAPKNFRFWWEMAEELHRRKLILDAPDFWWRAVAEAPPSDKAQVLEDMADTLWASSDFGRDDYLADLSLQALRKAGLWETLVHRLASLERNEAEIVEAIRQALVTQVELNELVEIGEYQISDWQSLGYFHADHGRFAEAFEAYGHALAKSDHPNDLLKYVLRDISQCAMSLKIDLNTEF